MIPTTPTFSPLHQKFNENEFSWQAEEECSVSVGGDKDSGFVEERRVSLKQSWKVRKAILDIPIQGGQSQEINLSYRPHTCFPPNRSQPLEITLPLQSQE